MIKSEFLKLKNSTGFYLVSTYTLLELLVIPIYLFFRNDRVSMIHVSLIIMLSFPILASILSIFVFEQESAANNFQEIITSKRTVEIWLSKLLVLDAFCFLPSSIVWLVVGTLQNDLKQGLILAITNWILIIFLNHFHILLSFFIKKGGNIIISIVETLFLVFASNKVLLGAYWCPVVLPVNFLLTINVFYIIMLFIWIVFCVIIIVLFSKRMKAI
ncbi:transporter [Streptococcus intermedius]|uniref:transporter n=1 Tax=Streptococcus intermedius TaxID=1338 RepID=UPI0039C0257A